MFDYIYVCACVFSLSVATFIVVLLLYPGAVSVIQRGRLLLGEGDTAANGIVIREAEG